MGSHISYAFYKYSTDSELGGLGRRSRETNMPLRIGHYWNLTFKNIVGNPPPVEWSKVVKTTLSCNIVHGPLRDQGHNMWFVYTLLCNRLSFRVEHGAHWVKDEIALEVLTLNPWQRNLMGWRETRPAGSIWRHLLLLTTLLYFTLLYYNILLLTTGSIWRHSRIIMSHRLRCRPSHGLEYFFWNVWSMSSGHVVNIWTMEGGWQCSV